MLDALKTLLATEYEVVGLFKDGKSLVDKAVGLSPDVVVLDISMPLITEDFEIPSQCFRLDHLSENYQCAFSPTPRNMSQARSHCSAAGGCASLSV